MKQAACPFFSCAPLSSHFISIYLVSSSFSLFFRVESGVVAAVGDVERIDASWLVT